MITFAKLIETRKYTLFGTLPISVVVKPVPTTTLTCIEDTVIMNYSVCDTMVAPLIPDYYNSNGWNFTSRTSDAVPFYRYLPGTYEIQCTATDQCNNIATCTQTITVTYPPCGDTFTATDADSNRYNTVRIGCDCWMAQNLKSTHYQQDEVIIPTASDYQNNEANSAIYGKLYSWYSVVKIPEGSLDTTSFDGMEQIQGVCPNGWRIPNVSDYDKILYLISDEDILRSLITGSILVEGLLPLMDFTLYRRVFTIVRRVVLKDYMPFLQCGQLNLLQ